MSPNTKYQQVSIRADDDHDAAVAGSSSRAPAASGHGRGLLLAVMAVMTACYMIMNTTSAPPRRKTDGSKSYAAQRDRMRVTLERDDLRKRVAELEAQLVMKDQRSLEAAQVQSSAAASAATASAAAPSLQQTLHDGLKPAAAAAGGASAAATPPPAAATGAVTPASVNYRLTKELIRAHCDKNNIILVTFVNSKRADYGYTWAAHVKRLQLTNYLVGAMDGEALKKLIARAIPTFDMESGLTTADYGWGTKNFRQLGLRKTELIINLLRAGADPILTDADALITRDPSPFIARLQPEAQILVTSDHLMSTTGASTDVLEDPQRAIASAWNIGYMYLRHDVLHAMLHWQSECVAHPTLWDQNLFKDVLKIGGLIVHGPQIPATLKAKRLFLGYNKSIAIGILPVATFCSGHTYFVQRMPQSRHVEPFSVHTTFQYSGAVGKTHRLREAMLWEDEPAYYTPPKSLLYYTPSVRRGLVRPAGVMDVASHFSLVHEQLVQLRAAFLLAQRLNRMLILPKLVCGLDRFWAPHNGTIPGSDTKLPIDPCPADHVIDLEHMARTNRGTVEDMLRESSFLENPRLPASVRDSSRTMPPPADLSAASIATLTSADVASVRVLRFERMSDLFRTLPPSEQEAVMRRMNTWTSIWCCSLPPKPRAPGHIWYDMFWDIVPHTTRHGKVVSEPWVPTFGP